MRPRTTGDLPITALKSLLRGARLLGVFVNVLKFDRRFHRGSADAALEDRWTASLNVTTGLSVILLVMVLISVRRAHIRVEYSVSWLLAAGVMLILSRARPLLDAVRNLVGLPDSPDAFSARRRRLSDHVLPLLGDYFAPAR
jgi:hypothetical protein